MYKRVNMTGVQKEFIVNNLSEETKPLREFAPGIISALMIISKIQSNVPINQWTFKNEDDEKTKIDSKNISQYYKKVIKPTEEEFKLHKEYLKSNLKKNFFS